MLPLRIAHRGCHQQHGENTLGAFQKAHELGLDGVEYDVQLNSEGAPYIFHDDTLERLGSHTQPFFELEPSAIRKERIGPFREEIPEFIDCLKQNANLIQYIELKVPTAKTQDADYITKLCIEVVEPLYNFRLPDPSTLASFDISVLKKLSELNSSLPLTGIAETREQIEELRSLKFLEFLSLPIELREFSFLPPSQTWLWNLPPKSADFPEFQGYLGLISDHWESNP